MKRTLILIMLLSLLSSTAFSTDIIGAGATFPYVFYSKVFSEYNKSTGIKVNYQAIGSGGGIRSLLARSVQFGATDAFMSDEEIQSSGRDICHIPMCLGAVVLTYNLPGNPQLTFNSDIIEGIFLGRIKKWDHPLIKKENPGKIIPSMPILTVHRSDGSGTTFIFTDYLSKVSEDWKNKVGAGKTVKWPAKGIGQKGNPGVAGTVKQVPGSIGYVEFVYALNNGLPVANIKNKHDKAVYPSLESVSLAADIDIPDHTRVSLTDTDATNGYPISSFTWIIVDKDLKDTGMSREQAKELIKLFYYMVSKGQGFAPSLHYAPIPDKAKEKAEKIINDLRYNGEIL